MRRAFRALVTVFFVGVLGACGGGAEKEAASPTATRTVATEGAAAEEPTAQVSPVRLNVTGKDYAFDVPATIRGGLVEISFTNAGQEPHFAGIARVAEGKTYADVKAAMTSPPGAQPPSGPPPYEEFAGAATIDPGVRSKIALNLPAGTYAVYCLIPAPDGASHAAKGMISEVTVTEGTEGALPTSVGTVTGTDFSLHPVPALKAGPNVVRLRNDGKQLHEINLVELPAGKKVEDVLAWYRQPTGPPPFRYLGGVAIEPGNEATTELEFKAGSTYAFICEIPDSLGDFQPHVAKGMFTKEFQVS